VDLLAEILPVLVALYVIDSALLVREGQSLFVSDWRGRFSRRGPGLRWPGLLPPVEAYLAATLPLRGTPDGLLVSDRRGGERLVEFESMEEVTSAEGALRLAPRVDVPVRPRSAAPEVARVVERLRRTPRERRLAQLRRELCLRCDEEALVALRERQLRGLFALRASSVASAVALFALVPASLVAELRVRPSPVVAVAVAVLLWAATLACSVRVLRDCGLGARAIGSAVLPMLLFPPAAAHAPSIVGRELYLGFEPLALARLLLPPAAFDRLARHPGPVDPPATTEAWDVAALVRGLVRRRAPAAPPSPTDATAGAYCPSCLAEYRSGFARCSDCDVPLESYGR
jgi:hypothetical protein